MDERSAKSRQKIPHSAKSYSIYSNGTGRGLKPPRRPSNFYSKKINTVLSLLFFLSLVTGLFSLVRQRLINSVRHFVTKHKVYDWYASLAVYQRAKGIVSTALWCWTRRVFGNTDTLTTWRFCQLPSRPITPVTFQVTECVVLGTA